MNATASHPDMVTAYLLAQAGLPLSAHQHPADAGAAADDGAAPQASQAQGLPPMRWQ
ncbi:MAG: hypothetical protein JF619_01025 [Massilia sp.]|nr:hypothetical protein [Massilia sp.]